MLIKSLKLKNIRSYTEEKIEFPTGSVLLSGDIGSGKSTILLAIEFALFGADNDRISGNALLRQGVLEGNVELTFETEGKETTVIRGLKRNKDTVAQTSGAIITSNGKKEATPTELKSDIIGLLGYPEELAAKKRNIVYRYTVYCPQEEMKAILSDDQEARLDTIRRIFGIDKYKRIRENTTVVSRDLKTRQKELEAQTKDIEQKKAEQSAKKEQLVQKTETLEKVSQTLEQIKAQLAAKKEEVKKNEEKLHLLRESRKRAGIIEANQRFLQTNAQKNVERMAILKNIISKIPITEDPEKLRTLIDQQESQLNRIVTEQKMLRQKAETITERIAEIKKELLTDKSKELEQKSEEAKKLDIEMKAKEYHKKQKEALEAKIKHYRLMVKEYEVKKAQADDNKKKILDLAVCPTCLQTVSKEHKEDIHNQEMLKSEEFKRNMQEEAEKLAESEDELKEIQKKIEHISENERKLAVLNRDISYLKAQQEQREEKKKMSETLQNQQQQIQTEREKYEAMDTESETRELKQRKETYEKAREKQRAELEIKQLEEAASELQRELKILETEKEEVKAVLTANEKAEEVHIQHITEHEKLQQEERMCAVQQGSIQAEKHALEENTNTLQKEIEEKETIRKKSIVIAQTTNWLDSYFAPLTETIEKHVMSRIYHECNELFRTWFSILIADENILAYLDDTFSPMVTQNGYQIEVNNLSGGERTSVALAYRLALNRVVNDIIQTIKTKDIIMLDEPTDGFSTEQLDRVKEVLDQLNVKQTIIVSHENKIESFVDKVVRIVKENGVSRVVSV